MNLSGVIRHTEDILRSFEIEPKPADRMLDAYYRRNRNLGPKERQLISDIVFGIMRWKRRLDGAMQTSGIKRPTNRQRAASLMLWKKLAQKSDRQMLEAIVGVELNFEVEPGRFPGGEAAYWSYPDFIYERLVRYGGKKWASDVASALNEEARVAIRVNTVKIDREGLQKRLSREGIETQPTTRSPFGLIISGRLNLSSLKSFREGLFEVQDEASQLIGLFVDPKRDEIILDVCAGAGGKTLLMAMLMKGEGRIVASDINIRKLRILKERAKQAGVKNIDVVVPQKLRDYHRDTGDVVLIDAPCSGTGTLKRNPDLKLRLSEEDISNCVKMQRQLLLDSALLVKKGGRLIYATCSILPDENEEVAEWFKAKSGWELRGHYFKTDPSVDCMDGFFAVDFRKP